MDLTADSDRGEPVPEETRFWTSEHLRRKERISTLPGNTFNPHSSHCIGIASSAASMNGISRENMSTNDTVDHCKAPNQTTYEFLSWLMIGEFVLALPLNLSVLYIFIFRYEETLAAVSLLF